MADIALDNANIFYSPCNWATSSTYARTVNQGAYIKFGVTVANTENVSLKFDVSRMNGLTTTRLPIIDYCMDNGAITSSQLPNSGSSAYTLTIATAPSNGTHQFQVWFRSVEQQGGGVTPDLWGNSPTLPTAAVDITAIVIGAGSSMAAPTLRTYRALFFGDSATSGAAFSGSTETAANNDARQSWNTMVARALDAEYGTIAFGGVGYNTTTVAGGAVGLNTGYALHYSGVSRTFPATINYCFVQLGPNDSSLNASEITDLLTNLRTALGSNTKIVQLIHYLPDSNAKASTVTSGYNAQSHANTKLLTRSSTNVLVTPGTASLFSHDAGIGGSHLNAYGQATWANIVLKMFYDAYSVPGRASVSGRVTVQ